MTRRASKYGTLISDRKAFPADEPMFVLRGKDILAPAAIECYANLLRAAAHATRAESSLGADLRAMADDVSNIGAEMIAWQAGNPNKVRLPD